MSKIRVAVVYGGRSGEHEISQRSARAVLEHIDRERFDVVPMEISRDGRWLNGTITPEPGANPGIDVVFPVLHGTFGEDGTIQGLFEMAGLAYVGAGVLASSVAMDKETTKRLCLQHGLDVVEYVVQRADELNPEAAIAKLGLPLFVKPANLGSSVGVHKVHDRAELEAALADAARYDTKILIERAIVGQELECAVLGNDNPVASTPCEILPSREFYDYDDKYLLDRADIVIPPRLSEATIAEVRRMAVGCFKAVECSGMARVDFLVEQATRKVYINEINTIPGFTSISMFPKMWIHEGMTFAGLITRLIELAIERHARRQALRYER
jgi:D-alanine-D-alanine ligase